MPTRGLVVLKIFETPQLVEAVVSQPGLWGAGGVHACARKRGLVYLWWVPWVPGVALAAVPRARVGCMDLVLVGWTRPLW